MFDIFILMSLIAYWNVVQYTALPIKQTYSRIRRIYQSSLQLLFSLTLDHAHCHWVKVCPNCIHLLIDAVNITSVKVSSKEKRYKTTSRTIAEWKDNPVNAVLSQDNSRTNTEWKSTIYTSPEQHSQTLWSKNLIDHSKYYMAVNLTLTNPHFTRTPHPANVIPLHNLGNKIPVASSFLGESMTASLPNGAEHSAIFSLCQL